MPFISRDEARQDGGSFKAQIESAIDWKDAKGEMDAFNGQFTSNENFFLIEKEDMEALLGRLWDLEAAGKEAYIAALFGVGESRSSTTKPPNKLTVVLFPVVYNNDQSIPDWQRYKFFKQGGTLDRENKRYIRQTWIDPSDANTSGDKQAIVKHFDEHA